MNTVNIGSKLTPQWIYPTLLLGFFLRLWQLEQTPPGLWYDEAYYAMDALWLTQGGPWQIFFSGNGGREPLFIYLEALAIYGFGAKIVTLRLLSAFIGTLTLPLMYVFSQRLMKPAKLSRVYIVATATISLTTSYWHVSLSRTGFRAVLLPLATLCVFYVLWRALETNSKVWWGLAGVLLGLAQYTYLAARVFPVVVVIFLWIYSYFYQRSIIKGFWILLTFVFITTFPLGYTFYQYPALFSARSSGLLALPHQPSDFFWHCVESAVRMFVIGGDPGWRENFPLRPMLGWLGWLGFWPGLALIVKQWRSIPQYLFLLLGMAILYSPALISIPPAHALRQASILPFYYLIFSFGLVSLSQKLIFQAHQKATTPFNPNLALTTALVLVLTLETGTTYYDYFYRWSQRLEVYDGYNRGQIELIQSLLKQNTPTLIPFELYIHPTTRYLLADFQESSLKTWAITSSVKLLTLSHPTELLGVSYPPSASWVLLDNTRKLYVSNPLSPSMVSTLTTTQHPETYHDSLGRTIATLYSIPPTSPLLTRFQTLPSLRLLKAANWSNQIQLLGYEMIASPPAINLYWQVPQETPFTQELLLQFYDEAGRNINQRQAHAFADDMLRWRPQRLVTSQHLLDPHAHSVRLSFVDKYGRSLPLTDTTSFLQLKLYSNLP